MTKSHRSTLTLFNQWPTSPPPTEKKHDHLPPLIINQPGSPGSPSQRDPFGTSSTLPSPVTISRPPSTVISPTNSTFHTHSTVSTPRIILASPSTSTIHYLFPSSETTRQLSSGTTRPEQKLSRSESARHRPNRPVLLHRGSHGESEKELAPSRKAVERNFPASPGRPSEKRKVTPLGPAKRVVSGNSVKKSDISGPIPSTAGTNAGQKAFKLQESYSMRTLRRQPSMADLGKGRGLHVEVDPKPVGGSLRVHGSAVLGEIRNQHKSWVQESISPVSPRTIIPPRTQDISQSTIVHHVPTPLYLRRRSRSLTSPRPAPTPPDHSPVLPAPDFGNPLSLEDVIPIPSFSHLDYSIAGSSVVSRRNSAATSSFTKHSAAVYPASAGMTRGDTRRGLGSYDSGKLKAHEDAARRLSGEGVIRRMSFINRSSSVKKDKEEKRSRPRLQSLSAKSIRDMGISPPVPPINPARSAARSSARRPSDPARGIYLGDLSVDLGGRYGNAVSPTSPKSTDTTLYPDSSPSSGYSSLQPASDTELRIHGRPLHPAFASEVSILAPSTVGLGFSPVGTPASLPESLEAEAIDLTETGRKFSATPSDRPPENLNGPSQDSPATTTSPRKHTRSVLLAQNTFFIPPIHRKPSLRSYKSMGPGSMPRAFTSSNLQVDQQPTLVKSPSILSKRSRSNLRDEGARGKRPNTTFFCSPPNAIEPLPPVVPETEPIKSRSNKSIPFMTASASLRVFFGKEGFVARSLSSAFDKDLKNELADNKEVGLKGKISAPLSAPKADGKDDDKQWRENVLAQAVSLSISSSLNRLADYTVEGGTKGKNTAPRMVSSSSRPRLGIPAQLLSAASVTEMGELTESGKKTHSTSVRRKKEKDLPVRRDERGVTPSEDGLETLAGIGEAMLRFPGPINSIDSGLNLRAGQNGRFVPAQDAPAVPLASPQRTLGQIGKEESMASASVYSHNAPTAKDSPKTIRLRSRSESPVPALASRWSPSPVKRTGKSSSKDGVKPIISPPLPLFTPANPSRLGLTSLQAAQNIRITTTTATPTLMDTVVGDDQSASVSATLRSPPTTVSAKNSPVARSRSRLLNFVRPVNRSVKEISTKMQQASEGLDEAITQEVKSAQLPRMDVQPVHMDKEEIETGVGRSGSVTTGVTSTPRLLDELTAREGSIAGDKERVKEERTRKVLVWRRGVEE